MCKAHCFVSAISELYRVGQCPDLWATSKWTVANGGITASNAVGGKEPLT